LLSFLGWHRDEEHPMPWKRILADITGSVNGEHVNPSDHYSCIWSFSVHWLRTSIFTLRGRRAARAL